MTNLIFECQWFQVDGLLSWQNTTKQDKNIFVLSWQKILFVEKWQNDKNYTYMHNVDESSFFGKGRKCSHNKYNYIFFITQSYLFVLLTLQKMCMFTKMALKLLRFLSFCHFVLSFVMTKTRIFVLSRQK